MSKAYLAIPCALLAVGCAHVRAPEISRARLSDACTKVMNNVNDVYLYNGSIIASAAMAWSADPLSPGFHHNVGLFINGTFSNWYDIVSDPCTVNPDGSVTFNLHPAVSNTWNVDYLDGDKWTFSKPGPAAGESYKVVDTTGTTFNNPATPGWSGFSVP